MATQQELQRFRQIVASSPQKQQFVERYKLLDDEKKEIAIQKVLAQSPIAPTSSRETITPTTPGFIKSQELVEQRVKARGGPSGGAMGRLEKEVQTPYDFKEHPFKSTLKPLVTGVKALEVPVENMFSAYAGAVKEVQQGKSIGDISKAYGKGFRGEKVGSLKDIAVGAGISPIIADNYENAVALAAIGGALKSGIGTAWKNWVKFRRAAKAKHIHMNNKFFLDQARKIGNGLRNVQNKVFGKADEVYSPIINKSAGAESINTANIVLKKSPAAVRTSLNKTNPKIIRKLKNTTRIQKLLKKKDITETTKTRLTKSLKKNELTVGELKTLKSTVGRKAFQRGRHFAEVNTEEQVNLQQSYWEIKTALDKSAVTNGVDAKELGRLNASLREFYNTNKKVGRLIYDSQGNIKTSELTGILKEGKQAQLETLYNFGDQHFNQAFDVINAIDRYFKIQKVKSLAMRVGVGIGAFEVARRGLRSIMPDDSGGGTFTGN